MQGSTALLYPWFLNPSFSSFPGLHHYLSIHNAHYPFISHLLHLLSLLSPLPRFATLILLIHDALHCLPHPSFSMAFTPSTSSPPVRSPSPSCVSTHPLARQRQHESAQALPSPLQLRIVLVHLLHLACDTHPAATDRAPRA